VAADVDGECRVHASASVGQTLVSLLTESHCCVEGSIWNHADIFYPISEEFNKVDS
jgi:hypothetical protein